MREEKQLLLDEIKEKIENSNGFIITRYREFTALRSRVFRDRLAENDAEFEVVRKRIFAKAIEVKGLHLGNVELDGHVGIVFARGDSTAVIKKVVQYGEENDKALAVLGGMIEGTMHSKEEIEALARLPALPELRAQFLGLLEAPMSQTVGTLQAIMTSLLYALEEKSKKESI